MVSWNLLVMTVNTWLIPIADTGWFSMARRSLVHLLVVFWPYLSSMLLASVTMLFSIQRTSSLSPWQSTSELHEVLLWREWDVKLSLNSALLYQSSHILFLVISSRRESVVNRSSWMNLQPWGTWACSARPMTTLGPWTSPVSGRGECNPNPCGTWIALLHSCALKREDSRACNRNKVVHLWWIVYPCWAMYGIMLSSTDSHSWNGITR